MSEDPTSKPLRSNLILATASILASLALAFLAGELYLRLFRSEQVRTPEEIASESLDYEATIFARHTLPLRPQTKVGPGPWTAEISERGYRGPAFAVPKPEGAVRIAIVGGSAVFDIYAHEGHDWPRQVEKLLRGAGHAEVEVINAGIPGHSSLDALGRLYSELWLYEPDFVLIYHAWNDIKYFRWLSPEKSALRYIEPPPRAPSPNDDLVDNPFMYYRGPLDRLLGHSRIYVGLRTLYWRKRLAALGVEGAIRRGGHGQADSFGPWGPRQFELALRLLVDGARDIGAEPILLTQARMVADDNSIEAREKIRYEYVQLSHDALVRAFEACDSVAAQVAAAEGVPLLDLSSKLSGREDLFTDHVHTLLSGSEAIAREVAAFLHPMLLEAQGVQ